MLYIIIAILIVCKLVFNKENGLIKEIRIKKKWNSKTSLNSTNIYKIDYVAYIGSFIWYEFITLFLSFIICFIITIITPTTEEQYSFDINSLKDNVITQGKFYCHRGYVDGELSYFFSRTMDKGEVIGHIPANDSYVRYDDIKHPQIEVVKQITVVSDVINYWMPMFKVTTWMVNENCEKEYIITVPTGTISTDGTYNIDME